MTTLNASFLKSNPNHDERGRFTTAGAAGAAAGEHGAEALTRTMPPGTDEPTLRTVRGIAREALGAMHDAAANLAAKARHVIQGTRITSLQPTFGGGVSIETAHPLPGDGSHVAASLQLHPWNVDDPRAKAAISAAHRGLLMLGKRPVAMNAMGSVRFKNGPAPRPTLRAVLSQDSVP